MTEKEEILNIEYTLRNILKKDNVRRYDVYIANQLLVRWKQLTNYKLPPSIKDYSDVLDETPIYKKEKK